MDSSTPKYRCGFNDGMASHLIAKKKVNYEFLDTYTTGFDKFKDYLEGKEDGVKKDTKWASKICGIDEKTIKI